MTVDHSLLDHLNVLVNLLLDSNDPDEQLYFSDICAIVDTYYKTMYINVLHIDRLIAYLTRHNHLSDDALGDQKETQVLKLFRGLILATLDGGNHKLSKVNQDGLLEAFGSYVQKRKESFLPTTWLTVLDIVRRSTGLPDDIEELMIK